MGGLARVVMELASKERKEEKVGLQMAKPKAETLAGCRLTLAASKRDKR